MPIFYTSDERLLSVVLGDGPSLDTGATAIEDGNEGNCNSLTFVDDNEVGGAATLGLTFCPHSIELVEALLQLARRDRLARAQVLGEQRYP
jgi:hypothetical protein